MSAPSCQPTHATAARHTPTAGGTFAETKERMIRTKLGKAAATALDRIV
jgi:hypothetical protein